MLKLGKGLKKKKKNKKGKKGEELFTKEELEQYKKEHAHKEGEEAGPSDDTKPHGNLEEFEKFKLLTAGVDDILKRTQGDLDRIKKESFFQRKLTPSELKAQEEKEKAELRKEEGNWEGFEDGKRLEAETGAEEFPIEESESEDEADDADDIFDTAYVDALESGEVKLAYVPDDDEFICDDGPDPFDTSSADQLLRQAEEEERKKKKEISLGLAVNVLSGRAERDRALLEQSNIKADTQEAKKTRARPRKIQDFCLLGSFDESCKTDSSDSGIVDKESGSGVIDVPKSILDEELIIEGDLPEGDSLISQIILQQAVGSLPPELTSPLETGEAINYIVAELDLSLKAELEIKKLEEEDEFDEFSALAASSVINQKLEEDLKEFEAADDDPFDTSVVDSIFQTEPDHFDSVERQTRHIPVDVPADWSQVDEKVVDPFDTAFAENCAPGKAELRFLEEEILNSSVPAPVSRKSDILFEARLLSRNNSEDLNHRAEEANKQQRVSIQITDPSGETQRRSESDEIVALSLSQRDLLGGSTTDLTSLADEPLIPTSVSPSEELSRYSDPFDTSLADQVAVPSKVELKFIEEELLSDLQNSIQKVDYDEDFDPRADDKGSKGVSFVIPSPVGIPDLLDSLKEEVGARPLTPFYTDPANGESDIDLEEDPFDTSHVTHLPGKQELKLIEQELEKVTSASNKTFQPIHEILGITSESTASSDLKHSLSDQDFNPRVEETGLIFEPNLVPHFSEISNNTHQTHGTSLTEVPDLLAIDEEISAITLPLTVEEDISSYLDPFDTSIAENIAPGKAELRVLEGEFVGSISKSYTDQDFNPRDVSSASEGKLKAVLSTQPLAPSSVSIEPEDIDPFDTSIAENVAPGKAELRLLESELVG